MAGQAAFAQPEEEDEPKQERGYIGIGGNVGFSGDESALGDGGFAIVSRTRIFDYLSLRNSTVFGDETASLFALTGEVPLTNSGGDITAIPFVGGGVWLHGELDPLLSVGVDVPLNDFTVTTRINVGFDNENTDAGLLIGIGYNFSLF
ncbi:MAG: hypothetical protein F6K42_37890 [Leptolyngbya sp. SIO1D8]|nr:hypothetical protein [Leptolyngbya sp. SIO1D8]